MYTSSDRSCQYQDWWEKRRPQTRHEKSQSKGNNDILLPLPAFPPALEFDPTLFALPPPYDEVVDLEKEIRSTRPRNRQFSDASTLYQVSSSPKGLEIIFKKDEESLHRPIRRHIRILRSLRYTVFTVYRRLFTLVFVLNLIGGSILLRKRWTLHSNHDRICTILAALASSNFLLAIFVRQDYLVNLLFRTAWLVPWSVPLSIRKIAARVYCYGGLHSGAAVAGTVWWIAFTAMTSWMFVKEASSFAVTTIAWVLSILLTVILVLSLPTMRTKFHNTFEITHRFLGWTCVALFWTQLTLLAHFASTSTSTPQREIGTILIHDLTFWNLILITLLLIYPWLRLRRWTFTAHVLSSHAIRLSFPYPIHRFSCLSISSSPLREWHPFATFPSTQPTSISKKGEGEGASMVISSAGDWTRTLISHTAAQTALASHSALITGRKPISDEGIQMSFWVKSHPKAGVLSLSLLFPRIIILTTGSGIGPALSSLLERPPSQHARLIWSTRSPLQTYGADIMRLVDKADPDAIVLDTDELGRPDLLQVVWDVARREGAEAVFVLSNEKVVRWVVGGLEGRGVVAYGPIWDS